MSFLVLQRHGRHPVLTDDPVLRREDVAVVRDALALARTLDRHRRAAEREWAAERARAEQDGYRDGHRQGLTEARAEHAERIAAHERRTAERLDSLRDAVADVAVQVVRRIADEVGPPETVAALARRAVRDLLPGHQIAVHVHPDCRGAVTARLTPLDPGLEVVPDPDLAPTDCRIVSPDGRIDAGLETQLAALERAFAKGNGDG